MIPAGWTSNPAGRTGAWDPRKFAGSPRNGQIDAWFDPTYREGDEEGAHLQVLGLAAAGGGLAARTTPTSATAVPTPTPPTATAAPS